MCIINVRHTRKEYTFAIPVSFLLSGTGITAKTSNSKFYRSARLVRGCYRFSGSLSLQANLLVTNDNMHTMIRTGLPLTFIEKIQTGRM